MKNLPVLVHEYEIQKALHRLGEQITKDYHNTDDLVVVGLLKGAFVFMADLIRHIQIPMTVDFMMVTSYNDNNIQEKEIRIILDLNTSIRDKDVLVVEDIIDSGRTFSKVLDLLKNRHPKSLKTCCLLDKHECRVVDVQPDYYGIRIPDKFVCGYGLDDAQKQRNLPYVGVVE